MSTNETKLKGSEVLSIAFTVNRLLITSSFFKNAKPNRADGNWGYHPDQKWKDFESVLLRLRSNKQAIVSYQ